MTTTDAFCNWIGDETRGQGTGDTTRQMDAFEEAISDLGNHSPSSNRRLVVFVTDATMENSSQAQHLTLVQDLDALTQDNGGGVFVSAWEADPDDPFSLFNHYSLGFTNDPSYPSLAANGGFDSIAYDSDPAPELRYLFDNLKSRVLYGQ